MELSQEMSSMMTKRNIAVPVLGALCLSVVVSLSTHSVGAHVQPAAAAHMAPAGTSAVGDPGWDALPGDPGWDSAAPGDPGWDAATPADPGWD